MLAPSFSDSDLCACHLLQLYNHLLSLATHLGLSSKALPGKLLSLSLSLSLLCFFVYFFLPPTVQILYPWLITCGGGVGRRHLSRFAGCVQHQQQGFFFFFFSSSSMLHDEFSNSRSLLRGFFCLFSQSSVCDDDACKHFFTLW